MHAKFFEKSLALKKISGFLLEFVTRTSALNLPAGVDKLKKIRECKKYVTGCLDMAGNLSQEHECDGPVPGASLLPCLESAVTAVKGFLSRLEIGCDDAMSAMLLKGELGSNVKEFSDLIPAKLLPLVTVVQTDWKGEIDDLHNSEADLLSLLCKIQKYLSARSLVDGDFQFPAAEANPKDACADFMKAFLAGLEKAVDSTRQCVLAPLDRFNDKYKGIEGSIEAWELQKLDWFQDHMSDEVQHDIKEFSQSRGNFLELSTNVSTHLNCKEACGGDLVKMLEKCTEFLNEGKQKAEDGSTFAASLLLGYCVLKGEPCQPTVDFLAKTFGTKFAVPDKLAVRVKQSLEQEKVNKSNKDGKDGKEKDAKTSSTKDKGKEKKEKAEKKDKDKSKKRDSTQPTAKPAKKVKK